MTGRGPHMYLSIQQPRKVVEDGVLLGEREAGVLEYIIQSSKHLSVEYCFLFFYSGFCFYSFFRKAKK